MASLENHNQYCFFLYTGYSLLPSNTINRYLLPLLLLRPFSAVDAREGRARASKPSIPISAFLPSVFWKIAAHPSSPPRGTPKGTHILLASLFLPPFLFAARGKKYRAIYPPRKITNVSSPVFLSPFFPLPLFPSPLCVSLPFRNKNFLLSFPALVFIYTYVRLFSFAKNHMRESG